MNRPDAGPVGALLGRLVLELGHPAGLAEAGDAAQHPGQLGVLGHLGLHEQRAPLRVEPDREQLGGRDPGALPQHRRVVPGRDRVQVDHAVEGVVGLLHGHPVAHRAEVVAEVERVGGRLDAGEHPGAARRERRTCRQFCQQVPGTAVPAPGLVRSSQPDQHDTRDGDWPTTKARATGRAATEQAMGELYHACYRRLVAQVYAFTTDLTEAQDVVQEAFARALARPRRPGRRGQPGGLAAHGRGQRRPPAVAAPQAARHDPAARPAGGPARSRPPPGPERADLRDALAAMPDDVPRGGRPALLRRPAGRRDRRDAGGAGRARSSRGCPGPGRRSPSSSATTARSSPRRAAPVPRLAEVSRA